MKQKRNIPLLVLTAVVATMLFANAAHSIVLYDVDFGTPPNTVALPPVPAPATGALPPPRDTVSGAFGNVTVVDSFGPLLDHPIEFNGALPNPSSSFVQFNI